MKTSQVIIFFSVVLTLYGLINFYITRRVLSVVPSNYKTIALITIIFIAFSFIAGRVLESFWVSHISDLLVWIGSFWIAVMFYTLLCLFIIDIVRLANHFLNFFPAVVNLNPAKTKKIVAIAVSVFVFITVAGGFINSKIINIRRYHVNIHKKAGDLKYLNIVMASDVHLGTINGKMFAYNIVDIINKLNPDIVLFAGDIIDEDIRPVLRDKVGDALYELKAKYGVYGITGNHEYIGGVKDAVEYLNNHKIKMLRDSSILIDNSFYVIGREDRSIDRFSDKKRKPLSELLNGVDKNLPLILMDHQPFGLNEAGENGVDLQLSGHTHNGQLWPINYIIDKIYDIGWGFRRIGGTDYYVSCGVGGWGPPVRTGSRPEIVNLKLHFIK